MNLLNDLGTREPVHMEATTADYGSFKESVAIDRE